jgi:hypothetical protein
MRKVFALIGLCHGAAVFAMKLRSRRRRVSLAKSPSAAFSHAEVACSERRSRAATRACGWGSCRVRVDDLAHLGLDGFWGSGGTPGAGGAFRVANNAVVPLRA